MNNILELLYNMDTYETCAPDPVLSKMVRVKNENHELLYDCLSNEQIKRLEAFFEAKSNIEERDSFDRFRYAFHLGAQLMSELIEGKAELLRSFPQA